MKVLNKAQVDALFQREAVLIGTKDVVPAFRAAALFGEGAVKHASSFPVGRYLNGYGAGGYTLLYLTYLGFQAAASFYNVQQLRDDVIEVRNYQILSDFSDERPLEACPGLRCTSGPRQVPTWAVIQT